MIVNGRQAAPTLAGIRADHLERYRLAMRFAGENWLTTIADVGCGTGYGSWMMHQAGLRVTGYELDAEALAFARKHYGGPVYVEANLADLEPPAVDLIAAFEIVEHTHAAPAFLEAASFKAGWLICSVPNEDVIPFGPGVHPEHVRHYRPEELRHMLKDAGWEVEAMGCQTDTRGNGSVVTFSGTNGRTLVAIARTSR